MLRSEQAAMLYNMQSFGSSIGGGNWHVRRKNGSMSAFRPAILRLTHSEGRFRPSGGTGLLFRRSLVRDQIGECCPIFYKSFQLNVALQQRPKLLISCNTL